MKALLATSLVAAVSSLALAGPSLAAAKHRHHAAHHRIAHRPQQQIACTALGCVPVPQGCWQTEGRTWSGMPSGNDVIVCPPGVAPFK
jgi:hypothetical protein